MYARDLVTYRQLRRNVNLESILGWLACRSGGLIMGMNPVPRIRPTNSGAGMISGYLKLISD